MGYSRFLKPRDKTVEAGGYIYLITNLVNKKIYVGQTTNSVPIRWHQHKEYARRIHRNNGISNAIRKYGSENFSVQKLAEAGDQETLNFFEDFYIEYFQTQNQSIGYNLREGGSKGKPCEESRARMAEAGRIKIFTAEHRTNLSKARRGKTGFISDEGKRKLSERLKKSGIVQFRKKPILQVWLFCNMCEKAFRVCRARMDKAKQCSKTCHQRAAGKKGGVKAAEVNAASGWLQKLGNIGTSNCLKTSVATKLIGAERARHTRWHLNRNIVNPDCLLCSKEINA
ncbi:MAG TPA: GIY-YIG nuclease family protein [Chitinophagaceae bacterium]